MNLQSFMLPDTLYVVFHIPLVNKSWQFNLYRMHNISLVHPILRKSFKYPIQEEYLAIRSDSQYISIPLSASIMACQVCNRWFCHVNSPHHAADTSNSCSYALFLKEQVKINNICILSVLYQTQDEALSINDNFWPIQDLPHNRKLYKTCLHYSYTIKVHFPYDIIHLPDSCETNPITFVLPSNNKLNIESFIEETEYKLGFNRSYSNIDNFSLMQSLKVSNLTDDKLFWNETCINLYHE